MTKILILDDDKRNQYLGHYYAYHYYKDNSDINNMEVGIKALKILETSVPKNYVKLLNLE